MDLASNNTLDPASFFSIKSLKASRLKISSFKETIYRPLLLISIRFFNL